ncbi:Sensor histidine kinase ResE [Lentibacillus sp. JNUCC-1]|uniref:hybrid sensor histidine kinase/response regulator n=1 Tax=Lentibacillus sp. JNUCC-1 TaxID=2654513 RepID=UPI0012E7A38C|nr:ATP-binding protein [Lentibacillus sp. JNUCC-1]MUV38129.1 Sensor histidine kinase ResE [Lentibacillus sp. JNUCC-1]
MNQTNQIMSKKNIFLTIIIFLILLSSFRLGWLFYHQPIDGPKAENGIIDLSDMSFTDNHLYSLDGQWRFYPNTFVKPNKPLQSANGVDVPGDWRQVVDKQGDEPAYGYGSYRLSIQLPDDDQTFYGLRFMSISSAAEVYINGELVGHQNAVDTEKGAGNTEKGPFVVPFHSNADEIDLIIHTSNFEIPFSGGLKEAVKIGTETAVYQEMNHSTTLQIAVSILYLMHSLYAFAIFLLGKGRFQRELLYYGVMLILSTIAILIDDEVVVQLPLQLETQYKLLLLLFNTTLFTMLLFIKHLFGLKTRFYYVLYFLYGLFCLGQLLVPFEHYTYLINMIAIYYLTAITFLFYQTIKAVRRGFPDAMLILLFITSYSSNVLWGAGIKAGAITIPYYPFDFIVSIFVIALLLFRRHIRVMDLNKQQTEELKETDRRKDEFLANTSHELRTPLQGIVNIADSVLEDKKAQSTHDYQQLNTLRQLAQRMTFSLNDLLDATRLKDQSIRLNPVRFNLSALATAVVDMTRTFSQHKPITFKMKIDSAFPEIYADENRVIQIMFNLLHNSIKFTNSGTVTISADVDDETSMALIHVTDTGIGIQPKHLKTIFQPYEQEQSTNHVQEGVGLGLSICRQLVELHGGFIMAESQPGKRTTFTFSLPLAEAGKNEKVAIAETAATSNEGAFAHNPDDTEGTLDERAKVLLVEDDPVNQQILHQILAEDYQVTSASSGAEALGFLKEGEWDLIISDVMMPEMSGYEFTRQVRKTYTIAELPVILLTARQQQEDIDTGFKAGANDYVTKPVTAVELKARAAALTSLKYAVKRQLRTEASWLQAQIQPHFLFNTLNTIAALSEVDHDKMIQLLDAFSDYLRKSVDFFNTEDLITIDAEIDLMKAYLYIEQARFEDRVKVIWKIDEHGTILIPPLSIQPLVENAVKHGILKRPAGGTIWIRALDTDDHWVVEVEDDGVGMDEEKAQSLLKEGSENGSSVALANTNKRLKQQFGNGLIIQSQKEKGTKMRFIIPK